MAERRKVLNNSHESTGFNFYGDLDTQKNVSFENKIEEFGNSIEGFVTKAHEGLTNTNKTGNNLWLFICLICCCLLIFVIIYSMTQ